MTGRERWKLQKMTRGMSKSEGKKRWSNRPDIWLCKIIWQVVPGRAGGGSFRRKKNCIAKKEFAYRMCARRPTSAMPKPFLCCERAFCCSMVVMWPVLMHVMSFDEVVMSFDAMWMLVLCHVTWCNAMSCDVPCNGHVVCSKCFCDNVVIQSTTLYYKVLLCTTKYYSSTTLYYNVLLQYYSVLQSTTTYYSSTTLYYKVLLQYYSVLQSTTPVLLCTAKYYSSTTLYYKVLLQYYSVLHSTTTYYSSTTLYYKVLLQYYSVLQSTTPVLLRTTKYYSSTTLYCKVLLQYYPVLQSTTLYYKVLQRTTPVLLRTTKYYSSTTLYCKVLLQYHPVLQSTTPVLFCTTRYYSSTTLYYKVLLQYYSVLHNATTYYSSTTLYYKVLLQYYSVLQTPVLLCTKKYYSSTTLYYKVLLQYYSVLHSTTTYYSSTTLYYKVLLQYYSVLQNTTPVLLCSTQYYNVLLQYYSVLQSSIHDWSLTHMNRHLHDWCPSHLKRHLQCAEQQESSSNFTKYCTCHAKWLWWLIRVTYETSFTMRGATGVTIQPHQILRLPRKMNLMIDPRLTWNIIYNARSNKSQPPTSPNTAPATQNESHDWSASHMKRHLQCAEQQESASHFTKYCACHAKWISWLIRIRYETSFTMRGVTLVTVQHHQILRLPGNSEFKISPQNPWIVSANRKTIRRQSDDNPTMIRAWNRHLAPAASETLLVRSWRRFCIEKYNISRSGYLPKCHEMLRLPRKVTLQLHQILRLPRKMKLIIDPPHVWNVIYNARSNKCHPPTSPNTAPVTQNESHDWSASDMKRHLQCAKQAKSTSNLTKYCACHAKWISWLIRVTYETSFTMRRASTVSHQPHQILRLPRNL